MLSFLNRYAKDYFASQNGEEGILLECIKRLGITKGHAVEMGANNGLWCSNSALLIRDHGWSATLVETDFGLWQQCRDTWAQRPDVKCVCSHVDKYNINAFVKDDCDLLSLDTDGSDYELFKAVRGKPKIVIAEIDSSIEPPSEAFNSDGAAGYWSMTVAGLEKGYFLLCHTGNLIFIDEQYKKLFPEVKSKHPLIDSEFYFNRAWVKAA